MKPSYKDTDFLMSASSFAIVRHNNQIDDNGENYFDAHLMQVYKVIDVICHDDINLLAAALLHDTLEDTDTTYSELKRYFSKDVADLVAEVTHEGKKDKCGYYFPNLKTQRGILLKFADRLSNLSRMGVWNEKRRNQYLKKSKFWKSSREE